MSNNANPLAVTDYDVAALPEAGPLPTIAPIDGKDGVPSFADVWIEHMGGMRSAAIETLNSFFVGFVRRRVNLDKIVETLKVPGDTVSLTAELLDQHTDRTPVTISERLSRRLAVATLLRKQLGLPRHGFASHDTLRPEISETLIEELELAKRLNRAKKTWAAAEAIGKLEAFKGPLDQSAHVEIVSKRLLEASKTVARERIGSSEYELRRSETRERFLKILPVRDAPSSPEVDQIWKQTFETQLTQPSDAWFATAASADRVAFEIYRRLKDGVGRVGDLRWDLYNLIVGHNRRRLPLSPATVAALYHAFGLIDGKGRQAALGGIVEREAFLVLAIIEAIQPAHVGILGALSNEQMLLALADYQGDVDEDEAPDLTKRFPEWRRYTPIYETAVGMLRKLPPGILSERLAALRHDAAE